MNYDNHPLVKLVELKTKALETKAHPRMIKKLEKAIMEKAKEVLNEGRGKYLRAKSTCIVCYNDLCKCRYQ